MLVPLTLWVSMIFLHEQRASNPPRGLMLAS